MAAWGARAVSAIPLSSGFPIRTDAAVGGTGLLFAVLLACGCALLCGAAPAIQLARVDPARALGHGVRTSSRAGLRRLTMGVQAVMVLMAAGLFVRSLGDARDIDPGFVREGVLLGRYDLTGRSVSAASSREFARSALAAMRALRGVEAAAIAQQVPLDIHGLSLISFTLDGRARTGGEPDRPLSNVVTPGYFATMGIEMVEGTDFVPLDDRSAERQAIVNGAFVDRYQLGFRRIWGAASAGHLPVVPGSSGTPGTTPRADWAGSGASARGRTPAGGGQSRSVTVPV